jgi:hypothetical protein
MSGDFDRMKDELTQADGKLAWVHPKVETFHAYEAEAFGGPYGTTDAGLYHS